MIIKKKQGFYYKQGVVVHFTLALFETDTLDTTRTRVLFKERRVVISWYKFPLRL